MPSDAEKDIFRTAGLGRTAGEVYKALLTAPATVSELMARTGRCRNAIKAALRRMAKIVDPNTGELFCLACLDVDGKYHAVTDVDFEALAKALGVFGATEQQKALHRRQREAFRRRKGWQVFGNRRSAWEAR